MLCSLETRTTTTATSPGPGAGGPLPRSQLTQMFGQLAVGQTTEESQLDSLALVGRQLCQEQLQVLPAHPGSVHQACDLSVGLAGQGGSQPSFRRQDLGAARQVGARSLPRCGFRAMQSMWRRGSFILHPVARPERRGFASTQRSLRRTPRPLGGVLRSRRAIGRRSWLSNRNEYGTLARWKREGILRRISSVGSIISRGTLAQQKAGVPIVFDRI